MYLPQIKLQYLQNGVVTRGQGQQHQIRELLASLLHSLLKARVLNKARKAKNNNNVALLFAFFLLRALHYLIMCLHPCLK
jgi:hypothetical protein